MKRLRQILITVTISLALVAAGCGSNGAAGKTVVVNVGYQSKTINTVTAGTLLRDRGTFEAKLSDLGKKNGLTYKVVWKDFPSGPPLTAQMLAGQVDIGSMGDYPILVNGAKSAAHPDVKTELIAVTGYNLRGSLNQVVVPVDSPAATLGDLRGKVISTSVGSAAHGMLVSALNGTGVNPDDVKLLNQEPPVGASAIEGKQVDALAQFVPWPQKMVFGGTARVLYDGGSADRATFHAVVSNAQFGKNNPDVMAAFLSAMRETTDYLNHNPLAAAKRISEITGLPPEVVYLYNGPNGLVSFDLTIKDQLVNALQQDLPFLKSLGAVEQLNLTQFIDDRYVRALYGADYDSKKADLSSPSPLTGIDPVCSGEVTNPATASEVWFDGAEQTTVAKTPTCVLREIGAHQGPVRAAYVPDSRTGTRIFAKTASWVIDPAAAPDDRLLPFAIKADAQTYTTDHPGSHLVDYAGALTTL